MLQKNIEEEHNENDEVYWFKFKEKEHMFKHLRKLEDAVMKMDFENSFKTEQNLIMFGIKEKLLENNQLFQMHKYTYYELKDEMHIQQNHIKETSIMTKFLMDAVIKYNMDPLVKYKLIDKNESFTLKVPELD